MDSSKELPGLKRCKFAGDEKELTLPGLKKCKFGKGENSETHLDVISFLSNNGKTNYLVKSNGEFVNLEAIRGKPLIICSFPASELPAKTTFSPDEPSLFWRVIIDNYPELSLAGFEMVVSVTVKRNKKLRFDKLISKLPCLSIPFSDLDTRNSVCSFINTNYKCITDMSAIVLDPTGMILPYHEVPTLFLKYRFDWFTRNVEDIDAEDRVWKARLDPFYKRRWGGRHMFLPESISRDVLDQPLSLHKDFLLCDPSRVLWRFSGGDDHQSLPVSELSHKHVALYLCLTGNFMNQLNEAYKRCLENNQELEVVLVCMPYFEEPKLYYEKITRLLKRYDIKSWFIFPFDNKVCHRLRRAFCTQWEVEKLIILPPNCISSGDLEGRAVIDRIGINTYPFTRSALLKQRVTALKSLTPASLFKGSCEEHTCLLRNGENSNVPHSAIKGKKLLLYLDWVQLSVDRGKLCRMLMKLYPKLRDKGCEVVFVPLDKQVGCPCHVNLAKMPWPMMPVEAAIKASVTDKIVFKDEEYIGYQVIVFGENGKILSRWTKETLMAGVLTKRLFNDYVRYEISEHLKIIEEEDIEEEDIEAD